MADKEMTGAFVRAERDGKFQSIDITDLTNEEFDELAKRLPESGWKWAKFLAGWIRDNVDKEMR